MNPSDFERRVVFEPAYDRMAEGYGVHGMNMRMGIIGPLGAVVFTVHTNWHLPSVIDRLVQSLDEGTVKHLLQPSGAGVDLHWSTPLYEGQGDDMTHAGCDWLGEGRFCYFDGSGLAAVMLLEKFIVGGGDVVWAELEDWYNSRADEDDPAAFEAAKADTAELHREIQRSLGEAP